LANLADFFPLFDKDEEVVYAEMAARANLDVQPDDPEYVDTRVGSFFYMANYPAAVGIAAAYSRMNEAAAAGIVATSWEGYLDLHAESYGAVRKAATYATGKVRFDGTPGTLVSSGVRVLPPQTDPDVDPPIFETIDSGALNAVLPPVTTATFTATLLAGGTVLLVGTNYRYSITAVDDEGFETMRQATSEPLATPTTGNRTIRLDWVAVPGAAGYRLYRSTGAGYQRLDIVLGPTAVTYADDGTAALVAGAPWVSLNATGGHRTLNVRALEAGERGNVAAGAITQLDTGVAGISAVVNVAALGGGTEVESDPALKARMAQRFEGAQGANVAWYSARALEEPGVGRVTVVPNWNGDGTVQVIIMDENGRNVSASIVASSQARLDPTLGQGAGQAPIDHDVTVVTPTVRTIAVVATGMTFRPGYSLDGANGTVALRQQLIDAASAEINGLTAGDDVVYNAVRSAFFDVQGFLDVATVTIQNVGVGSAVTTTIALGTNPPEVAAAGTVTLS
jgi:uncharacterized phage protein gp47/JayE